MFWKKKPKFHAPQITDATFNETIASTQAPILIDFYADWCGPCKILGPIIDELAQEYEGKALVVKVNTETNPNLSQHFKIKSIPTLLMIHKGNLVERFQGLVPKPNLEEILDAYIANDSDQNNNQSTTTMKRMTCKQLGGACDKEFQASTFEEIAEMSKQHGMEMFQASDQPHLQAMDEMRELMKTPNAMQEWFENKRKEFDGLPDVS